MQEPDYHDICESIAGIIAQGSKPLTQMQKMSLVGSVSIWLSMRDKRIEEMERVLRTVGATICQPLPSCFCDPYFDVKAHSSACEEANRILSSLMDRKA